MKLSPTFTYETHAIAEGRIVCGIDEAGRGPWAGPVVAAAVILSPTKIPFEINDSKQLSESQREALYNPIMQNADVGIGIVEASRIDEINILQATFEAMHGAVSQLKTKPTLALVDGNRAPPLSCKVQTLIKGDSLSLSIAAASIIAKVTRDRIMIELDRQYTNYFFARHKGYGTAAHAAALQRHGPCPAHRASFAPIRKLTMSGEFDSRGDSKDS